MSPPESTRGPGGGRGASGEPLTGGRVATQTVRRQGENAADDALLFDMESTTETASREAEKLVTDLHWRALRDSRHGVHGAWRRLAEEALEHLAATGEEFTTAEIYGPPYNVPRPPSSKWAGSITSALAKRRRIRLVSVRPSSLAETRGALVRVWVGVS